MVLNLGSLRIQTPHLDGSRNKRRKAVKAERSDHNNGSQSEDEDDDDGDYNPEDESNDDTWTHESDDHDVESSSSASPPSPTSHVRSSRNEEIRNATKDSVDAENSQFPSLASALTSASALPMSSSGHPTGTFLGVILPAVRSSIVSAAEATASSFRVTLDEGASGMHGSSEEDEEYAPWTGGRSVTVHRGRSRPSATASGQQAPHRRAARQASTSKVSKARRISKPSRANQHTMSHPAVPSLARADSPTFPADDPPTFGQSESVHTRSPRPERYVPAELVLAVGNEVRIIKDLVTDAQMRRELQAIVDVFQLAAASQVAGVVLPPEL